jgi:hypothetical protein
MMRSREEVIWPGPSHASADNHCFPRFHAKCVNRAMASAERQRVRVSAMDFLILYADFSVELLDRVSASSAP